MLPSAAVQLTRGPWPTEAARDWKSGQAAQATYDRHSRPLNEVAAMWPTPRASESENRTTTNAPSHGNGHGKTLAGEACDRTRQWQTPTVRGNHNRVGLSPASGDGLATAACQRGPLLLTTAKDGDASLLVRPNSRRLNPLFVEWLMGWPLGWTDFAPVATASSPRRLRTRGADSGLTCSANAPR